MIGMYCLGLIADVCCKHLLFEYVFKSIAYPTTTVFILKIGEFQGLPPHFSENVGNIKGHHYVFPLIWIHGRASEFGMKDQRMF